MRKKWFEEVKKCKSGGNFKQPSEVGAPFKMFAFVALPYCSNMPQIADMPSNLTVMVMLDVKEELPKSREVRGQR